MWPGRPRSKTESQTPFESRVPLASDSRSLSDALAPAAGRSLARALLHYHDPKSTATPRLPGRHDDAVKAQNTGICNNNLDI